jgi:hypothetical protein
MLGGGYQTVPDNVQHLYVKCRLSDCSGKCVALVCKVQAIRHTGKCVTPVF